MKRFTFLLSFIVLSSVIWAAEAPISLEECIKIALKNNTTLLNAKATLEDYRLLKSVARSDFMPTISAGISYRHQEWQRIYTLFSETNSSTLYSPWFDLEQTIWDGGHTIANNKKSKSDYLASKYDFEDVRQELIYSVEEAYLNLLKQRQLLAVYEETLKSSTEALRRAESMEEVGSASRTDVLKARVKVEEDRLNLIIAQTNLEVARANLNYLLGLDVNRETTVAEVDPQAPLDLDYKDAVQIALENHPALKKSQFDKESSEHTINMARSAYLPQLTGRYNFGYGTSKFYNLDTPLDNQYDWSAVLSLSINLFDGFSTHANISRAKVGKRAAQDNLEQARRDVILEVKVAYLGLEEAEKSIIVATERVLSAEEDMKLSTARYELEAGTILEQIDAQLALTSARAQKIQAEYNYRFAQSRLTKAMGKLK